MLEPHSTWHTPRKIWHISATLSVLPIFFIIKLLMPIHWPIMSLVLVWVALFLIITIDLVRMYCPKGNDFILGFPLFGFFRTIWRPHEVNGYAASTYSTLTVVTVVTLLFFNLIGEQVLVIAIAVMALCDPAASLTRFQFDRWSPLLKRFISFLIFVGSCFVILVVVSFFYRQSDWDILLAVATAGALCEVYLSKFWHLFVKFWKKYLIVPKLPLWLSSIYLDDNLTAPLAIVFVLMLFGY